MASDEDNSAGPALALQSRLRALSAERFIAVTEGLDLNAAYKAHLDAEIAEVRIAYVAATVTEIASLRGELFGAQVG